jgi:hypothetical protein
LLRKKSINIFYFLFIFFSYQNAHLTQIEIANLSKKEQENFEIDRIKRFEKEVENIRNKQNNETRALELRIQSNYNQFKRDRAIQVESLLLKYKNKFRELENKQKNEIKLLEKIIKEGNNAVKGKNFTNYNNQILTRKSTNISKLANNK